MSATWLCADAVQIFVYFGYLISTGQRNTVFESDSYGLYTLGGKTVGGGFSYPKQTDRRQATHVSLYD
jgi:hypothetical protein